MAKTQKWTASTFVSLVHENLAEKGFKVKKSDLNWAVQDAFEAAVTAGARGMRVRFPQIGALAWREVVALQPRLHAGCLPDRKRQLCQRRVLLEQRGRAELSGGEPVLGLGALGEHDHGHSQLRDPAQLRR